MTEQPAHPDTTEPDADIADLGYEEARQELVELVARLEGGQAGLEESMRLWQRGEALAAHCEAWLDKAEASLSQEAPPAGASEDPSGTPPTDG
ncbi:exodeoxyribonuclease VII small subunit [Janibacter sp. DB-40]|uniref:exodeoxyribonuclease VII small subunit n=1 Tax=Janibacter sp. DB-40 TaxID=3028808 RepID=UPI0024061229|nr:exodeoxyribonuclease VII small subunit [Janibacter sp. DB-40]